MAKIDVLQGISGVIFPVTITDAIALNDQNLTNIILDLLTTNDYLKVNYNDLLEKYNNLLYEMSLVKNDIKTLLSRPITIPSGTIDYNEDDYTYSDNILSIYKETLNVLFDNDSKTLTIIK